MSYSLEIEGTIYDTLEKEEGFSYRKLKAAMVMAGYKGTARELSTLLGYTAQAAHNKAAKRGGKFTRQEICIMVDALKLEPEAIIDIFFANTYAGEVLEKRRQKNAELMG